MCQTQPSSQYDQYFSNCVNSTTRARENDLYSPFRVFYQSIRRGFCIAYNNDQNFNTTIGMNFNVTTTEDFTNLQNSFNNSFSQHNKTYIYFSDSFNYNIPAFYDKNFVLSNFTGYNPNDNLMISKNLVSSGNSDYSSLRIPIVNSYGRCKNGYDSIRFLRNKNFICSYKLSYTSTSCLNYNSLNIPYDISSQLLSYNSTSNLTFLIKPTINIYKVTNKFILTKTNFSDLITKNLSSFTFPDSNNKCKCSNLVTSVIHELQMLNGTITGYNLNYYLEDFSNNCDKSENIPVNYRINFISADKVKKGFLKIN
jgi:hypothetical protein